MNEDLARLRTLLNKLPFQVLLPFMVAIYVLSMLLVFLYGLLLRPMVWIEWQKRGTDVLVIEAQSEHSREWIARLSPLVSGRAVFLNWN